MTAPITLAEFKSYFVRDFEYGTMPDANSPSVTVMDSDITRAMTESELLFNTAIWPDEASQKPPFYLLTAHCLAVNIQTAGGTNQIGQGVAATGTSPIQSKSVGPVSVSYALPQSVIDSPVLNQFMKTGYGQKYLQLVMPRIVGNVATAYGATNP